MTGNVFEALYSGPCERDCRGITPGDLIARVIGAPGHYAHTGRCP